MIKDTYPSLLVHQEGNILTIAINRPASLNAINAEVMQSLHDIFSDLPERSTIRGIILTGAGDKAFVAGADIKDFSFEEDAAAKISAFGHKTFNLIENCRLPVIAAVNGFALGGGCELAMACHMRVASDKARFGQPELKLGLIPGYGGTQRLAQLVGKGIALELILSGEIIDAQEAYRIGLANKVVPEGELVTASRKLLSTIAQMAPLAVSYTIDLVNRHYRQEGGAYAEEITAFDQCFQTADAREGITAFIEKRRPNFSGK